MLKLFRDRAIIAACLMLYALGMVTATLAHAIASSGDVTNLENSVSFDVLCSGDMDQSIMGDHCPFCRLVEDASLPDTSTPKPLLGWEFASYIDAPVQPLRVTLSRLDAAPRAPPLSS